MKKIRLNERQLDFIINNKINEAKNNGIKYYHGGDEQYGVSLHNGVIWITDSPEYAKLYAEESQNPAIFEILIDEHKLKPASLYNFPDWFDGYDAPNNEILNIMHENNTNCWFMEYDASNAEGIALIDLKPIIQYRKLSDEEYNNITIE